jgi:hypothetical protein
MDCGLLSFIIRASENGGHLSENEDLKEEKRLLVSADDLERALAEGLSNPSNDPETICRDCGLDPDGVRAFFAIADVPKHEQTAVFAALTVGVVAAGIRDERIVEGF